MPAVKIFACTQSTELAGKIAQAYGIELGNVIFSRFSDGEFQPSFEESVRGARVFYYRFYASYFGKPNGDALDD